MISEIEFATSNPFVFIQNILSTTKCYDIMQNSSKVVMIYIYIYQHMIINDNHHHHHHHHHLLYIYIY